MDLPTGTYNKILVRSINLMMNPTSFTRQSFLSCKKQFLFTAIVDKLNHFKKIRYEDSIGRIKYSYLLFILIKLTIVKHIV